MNWIKLKNVVPVLIVLGLVASGYAQDIKVAYVDLQRALNESEAGKLAFKKLQDRYNLEKDLIREKEDRIRELMTDISQKGLLMSESAKREKEDEYLRERKKLERYVEDSNSELSRKEKEITQRILLDVIKIVQDLGVKDSYTMIYEKREALLYADEKIDITDKVIELFNKQSGTSKKQYN